MIADNHEAASLMITGNLRIIAEGGGWEDGALCRTRTRVYQFCSQLKHVKTNHSAN